MKPIKLIAALLMIVVSVSFSHAADIAAGKEKAELCVGCHGEGGISQTENVPSLAAQPDQFIQWQLVFFRAGTRKNEQMQPIVEQIDNEDIRNLGAYFASLTPPKAPPPSDLKSRTQSSTIGTSGSCSIASTSRRPFLVIIRSGGLREFWTCRGSMPSLHPTTPLWGGHRLILC